MSFVSYAQNFEDVLLHRVFGGQETGFYVDVGAYHPVEGSVTKAFYDRGWSGINVEPGSVFEELAAARPRDINLRMAVLDREGEVAFVEDAADRGMSHVAGDGDGDGDGDRQRVPCDTLEAIVRAHARGRPVDFVKLDAEGAEAAIIRATDWRRFRPRVLVVEATQPWSSLLANQEWEPALLEQGYVRAYFDGINCFYIPEEEGPALLRHFQVPVNVLDSASRFDPAAAENAAERARLGPALAAAEAHGAALAARLGTLEQDRARLVAEHAALAQEHGALAQDHGALQEAHARLRDDAARLGAERDAVQAEREGLVRQRDSAAAAAAAQLDALTAQVAALTEQRDTATAQRDGLAAQLDALAAQFGVLASERDAMIAAAQRIAEPPGPVPEAAILPAPAVVSRRPAMRRVALAGYRIVRPVVRPLVWRLRTFMVGDLAQRLDERTQTLPALMGELQRAVREMPAPGVLAATVARDNAAAVAEVGRLAAATSGHNTAVLAEMRQLADAMERALLTLALEPPRDGFAATPP